jgi:hypothetical protein
LAWKIGEDIRTVDDGQRGITVTIELTPIVELTTAMALVITMNSRTPGGNGNYSSAPICTTPALAQQAILANEQRQFRPISIEVWNETCRTFGPMPGMEIDITEPSDVDRMPLNEKDR